MAVAEPVMRFTRDVGWVLVSTAVALVAGFLTRPLLARWLGADGLGLYSLAITILGMGLLLANFGVSQSILKYVAEDKDDKDRIARLVFSGFSLSLLLGAATGGLLYAFRRPIASFFDMPEVADFLPMIALALPFTSLFTSVTGLFNGTRQLKVFATLMTSQSILRVVLVLALVGIGTGVKGAVWGIVLAAIGTALLGLYLSRRYLGGRLKGRAREARRLLGFGGQMFTANAANMLLTRADIVLIGHYLVAADVGHYSAAVTIVTLFPAIPNAVQRITFPATSELWARHDHTALENMMRKSMKYSACIIVPLGLALAFFAKDIIRLLFGPEFVVASTTLSVLLIAKTMRGGTVVPIGNVLAGIGRPDLNLKIELMAAGMNVGLNVLLIPRYGILGAAVATTVSLVVAGVAFLAFTIRLLPIRIDLGWHAWAFGTALVVAGLFWGLSSFTNHFLAGSLALVAYVAILLGLLLTKQDRSTLTSIVGSFVQRR